MSLSSSSSSSLGRSKLRTRTAKKKRSFKNVYLRNYPDLVRYISNDFKHLDLPPKAVAEYIDWLEHNITQRPLLYITHVLTNEVNTKLSQYCLTLKITQHGFKIEKLETEKG